MEHDNLPEKEPKVIDMKDYLDKKALIGILNRKELSEEMKTYPQRVNYAPVLNVVYNRRIEEEEQKALRKRFYARSDHLD